MVTIVVSLLLPSAGAAGRYADAGQPDARSAAWWSRLNKTAQNELMNIVTIFLGTTVGATANGRDLPDRWQTLVILAHGHIRVLHGYCGRRAAGQAHVQALTHGKINPLIGSAGVSAVPMAARVSQVVGQKENPSNFLLMHAMGPNVAGVIGSAVAAGVLLSMFGGVRV